LPHSDIHGSKPARGSPWLFAACHVLHRLLVPRHPPNALLSLKTLTPGDHRLKAGDKPGDPPCTETILRKQSSVFSRQLSETTAGQIPAPSPKNDPVLDHLAQYHRVKSPVTGHRVRPPIEAGDNGLPMAYTHTSLNTSATIAGGPVPHEEPSRDTDHIRSDLRPRRAQRRTRT
jgi:hypothetical protein